MPAAGEAGEIVAANAELTQKAITNPIRRLRNIHVREPMKIHSFCQWKTFAPSGYPKTVTLATTKVAIRNKSL
jgi:hypothetical protein